MKMTMEADFIEMIERVGKQSGKPFRIVTLGNQEGYESVELFAGRDLPGIAYPKGTPVMVELDLNAKGNISVTDIAVVNG